MQWRNGERFGRHDRNPRDCDDGDGNNGGGGAEEVVVGAVRPVDGRGTNPDNPEFGATGSALLRLAEAHFADGTGAMVTDRPDARVVSNIVVEQEGSEPNTAGASDFLWVWGQFLDHDLDLTRQGNTEPAHIPVPAGDPDFDPEGTGQVTLPFFRATPVAGTTRASFPTRSPRSSMPRWSTARTPRGRRACASRAAGLSSTSRGIWRPMRTVGSWPAT
jgi:Animal haem peroxidase